MFLKPDQQRVYDLIRSYPDGSMIARHIHGLLGRENREQTNKILAFLKRFGYVESQPTNNRRLGTRWTAVKNGPAFRTFQEAVAAIPLCLVGGYDALTHKTLEDLRFLAMHELDLYAEGEVELSHNDLAAVVKFRNRILNTISAGGL